MELEKKRELILESREVSYAGMFKIRKYIRDSLDRNTCPSFPSDWDWNWMSHRGKLPNRIAGMLKSRHDIKLTTRQKSEIGNIAKQHLLNEDVYTFDFTDKFDWEAGDFGDHGSCFWEDNYSARKVMEDEGAIAIRFYDENGKGIGRAWLYELSKDAWVLFNAYGQECSKAAHIFAISQGENWLYQGLDCLTVNGTGGGLVYINSCPQIIYRSGYNPENNIDLDWYIPCFTCASCGCWVDEDDLCWDEDGDAMCYDCWEEFEEEKRKEHELELEEQKEIEEENEKEEEFQYMYGQAVRTHALTQAAIRAGIREQLVAGQMVIPEIWVVYTAIV